MRKVTATLVALLVSMSAFAQDFEVRRGDCMPDLAVGAGTASARAAQPKHLPAIVKQWDSTRVYRQLVILVSFSDVDFQEGNSKETYEKLFNQTGYHLRNGKGCVADYFRDQSNGLLNLQFDIYGPYKVDGKAQPYANPNENTRNYGRTDLRQATEMFLAENPELDFSPYDWYNQGKVNQVIYVYAGTPGNSSATTYGCIWPNTSTFTSLPTHDGKVISSYSCSGEHWPTTLKASCGIGTICHEFTHCLGLPDLYPTVKNAGDIVIDEWDLMDGGNFTNYGWCPPCYTPLEKMLLGWAEPVELTEPASIKDLKPSADGGAFYRIKHSDSEWLLLENRQQKGWDAGAPGKGLVVYHVNYDGSVWSGNTVNNDPAKRRYDLVHADNRDYDAWDDWLDRQGKTSNYQNGTMMNNWHLSQSPYPWTDESSSAVNDQLTDTSVPAATMHYPNGEGSLVFGKPITNITMSEDGLISFDFMGGKEEVTAVEGILEQQAAAGRQQSYDLAGRKLQGRSRASLYVVRETNGKVRKVVR